MQIKNTDLDTKILEETMQESDIMPGIQRNVDVCEEFLAKNMPEILDILLIDRTKSKIKHTKNIIWANDNYTHIDNTKYAPEAQILPELITGGYEGIIKPRALKTIELQKQRTKSKAEVFTPSWIVKIQNDAVDELYKNDNLETYIARTWLEITCGEAPYMTTRYEMSTGEYIPIAKRVGFLDRKLQRINNETKTQKKWKELAIIAYQACYGFEWSGDSLLLARENLLYTLLDYYYDKWGKVPPLAYVKQIAEIISYNVFQMDGIKRIIPLSDRLIIKKKSQLKLFDESPDKGLTVERTKGIPVKVMNWSNGKMELFAKGVHK